MTPAEYRAALETLGLGFNEFARLCDMDERRARRWADDDDAGPSPIAAAFLRYMIAAEKWAGVQHEYEGGDYWATVQSFREHTRKL